jgi:hypothetical protein
MQAIIATLFLGLLLWAGPAGAQTEHALQVSVHRDVRPTLSRGGVEKIFERASKLMSRNSCDVKFKLDGQVTSFASAPSRINDSIALEAVHRVAAHIKVVQSINFCMGRYDPEGFIGCAWRPWGLPKTVIVTTQSVHIDLRHILWAHEFGHATGLQHRTNDGLALMTPCKLELFNRRISQDECGCFRRGLGGCPILGPDPDPSVSCAN